MDCETLACPNTFTIYPIILEFFGMVQDAEKLD